jgi:hypothetical protein
MIDNIINGISNLVYFFNGAFIVQGCNGDDQKEVVLQSILQAVEL